MYSFISILSLIEITESKQCRALSDAFCGICQMPSAASDCQMPTAASDVGLHCLPMSNLWDARHIYVLN